MSALSRIEDKAYAAETPHEMAHAQVLATCAVAAALEQMADALTKALEGGVLYTRDADRV